jgi:predicted P-loop ATPase
VGVTGNIDFTDNLNHQQLFAQALNLFNQGERFWLDDNEIKQLIKENEPYQHINELVEMIGETFRNPEEGEQGKWWSIAEISDMLSSRYASFDSETSFKKIGNALNDVQFSFKNRRTSNHMEYWLVLKE